ncbi:MAG: M28 family peptidase [Candidatus Methylomirabilales bacterium]
MRDRLEKHVSMLAGEIGERNIWHPQGLEASVDYIEKALKDLRYQVEVQEFNVEGTTVANLEAERIGTSLAGEIVIVGAHYDSVIGTPGANDNASGVAGLLEIARLLATEELSRTVRFVAFVNEEPPFFLTGDMGSRVYASRSRQGGEDIVAMLSIETIGYYSEDHGSQHYPFPFSYFYPNTANFIGFIGNFSSRRLVRRAIGTFRKHTNFPSEGLAAPEWVTGVGWSDHWSFWKEGYPAIMVTDTALFRYDHYHTPQDTPEKLDYARTARVVTGLTRVVADLAGS